LLLACVANSAFAESPCVDCPEYVALSAKDKEARILELMKGSEYAKFPNDWVSLSANTIALGKTAHNGTIGETFDRYSDQYMTDHSKVIHTHGSVATVALVPTPSAEKYTGLFRGAAHGVIRLSLVKDPEDPCYGVPFTKGCFSPGIALKAFRNGTYSSNLIAMHLLGDNARDYNFFGKSFKTWVPLPTGLGADVVNKIFAYAAKDPHHLANWEFASGGSGDENVDAAKVPSNVYFVPNPTIANRFSSSKHEFRDDLAKLSVNTALYNVVVVPGDKPCLCKLGKSMEPCEDVTTCDGHEVIGKVVTTSRFIASAYGDQSLFFNHARYKRKARKACSTYSTGGSCAMAFHRFPSSEVYRMSGDHCKICVTTTTCPSGTNELPGGCPFNGQLDTEGPTETIV
jgi:hypothetical protein